MRSINKKAFTLIEMLVVVLIIGILAAIALPKYQAAVEKARSREVMALMRSIKNAADMVKMIKGGYTAKFDDLDIVLPCQARGTTTWGDWCDTTYFRIFLHNGEAGGANPQDQFNIFAHREKIAKISGDLSKTYEIHLTTNNPNSSSVFLSFSNLISGGLSCPCGKDFAGFLFFYFITRKIYFCNIFLCRFLLLE